MKKRTYIVFCVIFLLILATNIGNDKYKRIFLNESMKISNKTNSDRYSATIYGDETKAGTFAEGPYVYLYKGDYTVTIDYRTDTDKNYVKVGSEINGEEVKLTEEEGCLYYSQNSKVIHISTKEDIPNFNIKIEYGGIGTFVLERVVIESVGRTSNDTMLVIAIFMLLFIIIGRFAYGKNIKNRKEKLEVIFALAIITICSSYTFFSNGIILGHDIFYHLDRIEGIKSGLLAGQFPVRIHTDIFGGYGYASSMFYPELFLYIPAFLRILGVSLVTSVQVFGIFVNFLTAFFMYMSAFKMSKSRHIGMISSALYVLSTYHLCDMYTRFAIGEVIAMAFLPLIIYGIYELVYGDYTKWKYAVAGITGVMQSHILTIVLTIPLVVIVAIVCIKKFFDFKRILACLKAIGACLLLNIWFLVPFLQLMKEDINLEMLERTVADNALYVSQLFESFTSATGGRNVMGTSTSHVMPVHIGLIIIVGAVLAIIAILNNKLEQDNDKKVVGTMIALGLFTAYATTYLFPWEFMQSIPMVGKIVSMVQFPWRLLAYSTAFLAIAGAYGIYYIMSNTELRKSMVLVTVVAAMIPAALFLDDFNDGGIILYRGEGFRNTEVASGEYFYTGTSITLYKDRGELVEASSEQMVIQNYNKNKGKIVLDIFNTSAQTQYVEVPLLYYPGYTAILNSDTKLLIEKGKDNVLRVNVPANTSGSIIIKYQGRKLWDLCTVISLITLFALIIWHYKGKLLLKKIKKV